MGNKITAAITSVSGYVPEKVLSNKDLEKMVEAISIAVTVACHS